MSMREDREKPHYKEYYQLVGEIAEKLKQLGYSEADTKNEGSSIAQDLKD